MAGETTLTVIGNLTADPELRFTPSGVAVASFTVASTPRTFDRQANEWRDGETLFMRCSVWREVAENVAESLTKGMRVIVRGRLEARSYKNREGENRTSIEMQVDEVGPSLRYAKAQVTRNPRENGGGGNRGGYNNGGYSNAGSGQSGQGGYGNQGSQGNQGGYGQSSQGGYSEPAGGGAGAAQDPWATGAGSTSFDDEPPF